MAIDLYAVVLVGGKGKRLRPLSTDKRPKAFLSVTKDRRSMFANTVRRIRGLVPAENIIVVANKAHARLVKKDFPGIKRGNLILEPVSRNTAPAVAVAARLVAKKSPGAIMAVLPTDHYLRDEKAYLRCVEEAADILGKHKEAIVVFGIRPTFPSTEFGYIKLKSSRAGLAARGALKADRFVEKPDIDRARAYFKSGLYLWNSGTFIFNAGMMLKAFKRFAPKIHRCLKDGILTGKSYSRMPDISLDYAVMERSKNIYCVKGSYGWNDVGSFKALRKVLRSERRKFSEKDGKIVRIY